MLIAYCSNQRELTRIRLTHPGCRCYAAPVDHEAARARHWPLAGSVEVELGESASWRNRKQTLMQSPFVGSWSVIARAAAVLRSGPEVVVYEPQSGCGYLMIVLPRCQRRQVANAATHIFGGVVSAVTAQHMSAGTQSASSAVVGRDGDMRCQCGRRRPAQAQRERARAKNTSSWS